MALGGRIPGEPAEGEEFKLLAARPRLLSVLERAEFEVAVRGLTLDLPDVYP